MVDYSTQLIDGNGEFNVTGLDNFMKAVKLRELGLSYAVVAIMGPQSSGKSTLLNHLFHTRFREMDAFKGRSQTTKGIWIAKAVGVEPCTIVMDLEGTDGRERGEDDTTFEKQSALFALAVSGHRIDKYTPLEHLEPVLREDIQKIWDTVSKPQAHKDTPLKDLQSFSLMCPLIQVAQLRQRFFHSIAPGGLAGDRRGVVPASGFSFSAQQIWKVIKENKDLDLPAHKVMVASVRCEEIANEKLSCLTSDVGWVALEEAVRSGTVSGFGKKLSSIIETYLSEYDMEAFYFDEGVRKAKRQQLETKVLQLVHPAYSTLLGHLRSKALESFKTHLEQSLHRGLGFADSVRNSTKACMLDFEQSCADATIKQANWDASKVREKLRRDIEAHASSVRSAKLSEIVASFEKKLGQALAAPVESLLEASEKDTWSSIRRLLKRETDVGISEFSSALTGFELDQATFDKMVQNLRDYARSVVEKKCREEAGKVLIRMKDRFSTIFNHDTDSMPRVWTGAEDIRAITKDARSASLKLLSVMAATRLDEKPDKIENVLFSSLMDGTVALPSSQNRSIGDSVDPLASSSWEEVPPENTLITPVQCKSLWRQFKAETEYTVTQAISAQEAHKRNNNWLPPPWAIMAMVVLGFNEFMLLLKNPLYLMALFVIYLLAKALWVQMDIAGEFHHGPLAGLLSLSSRFLPTVMNLLRKLAEEAQGNPAPEAPRPPQPLGSHNFKGQTQQPNTVSSSVPVSSVSSNISSTESGDEYSSPQLTHRRVSNVEQAESS
ncbi:hypothetical protein HYC85_018967 [Camellia sinensis]|uniref:GB1/RHD3-type G domain-containing protein n=1 Tax=Camellia sinensis TaxID=4442 RepID=A0A7J7GW56_CAMSI|nr:hypothetical protein HYC85_018967 [Camellia sinensis]